MPFEDPAFWRAGAVSTIIIMLCVLAMLTVDSLAAIGEGGSHVPTYTVINRHIDYTFDSSRDMDVPVIGGAQPLFGRMLDESEATEVIAKGKLVIQSRACMDCHTIYGNGAYYGPDLTKAWLDPDWDTWKDITGATTREEAMVRFLMDPVKYRTWTRTMPDMHLSEEEARAVVAYLKWTSAVDTNGFPANFAHMHTDR
jgi:nitric oxide reductase subunit C